MAAAARSTTPGRERRERRPLVLCVTGGRRREDAAVIEAHLDRFPRQATVIQQHEMGLAIELLRADAVLHEDELDVI